MGWKWPVIVLSVLGLLGLAGWGIPVHLEAVLDEHRHDCLAIQELFPVDVSPRPPILGPEEKGNVWELLLPAFAGLEELDEFSNINNFDAHGATGDTRRLIDAAHPYLALCRRAACRRDRTWSAPSRPGGDQAARGVRALSSKGLLLWRDGHDAEGAEWMVVALTVGYDWTSLSGEWDLLKRTEKGVVADLLDLLSEQSLTPAQLEDLGRRLELLRSVRPSFIPTLRRTGANARLELLEEEVWIREEGPATDHDVNLSDVVGWRDFWSVRFAKVRILNDLRRCGRELEGLSWKDPEAAVTEAERIINSYQGRYVHALLPYLSPISRQKEELTALDVLSAAVACARFQALHGRLPRTWEEAGIPARGIELYEGGLVLPDSSNAVHGIRLDQDWPIGRRSGTK